MVFRQDWRGAQIPPEGVGAVELLEIFLPDDVALKVQTGQIAAAVIDEDMRGVGGGGGVGAAALAVVFALAFVADGLLPENLAGAIDAEDEIFALAGGGHENAVIPDGRGGTAGAGQGELPCDIVRCAPGGGDIDGIADAVEGGAAPGRPVVGGAGGDCT